jgi:hypothetical protein
MNLPNGTDQVLRSEKGQALIELTLMFPFLLLLLYGTIEIATAISAYHTLTGITREGANLTSRGETPDTALDAIVASSAPTITAANSAQWHIIYSKIVQDPSIPCTAAPCTYIIESQKDRGGLGQGSQLGGVGATVTIPGTDSINPGQTFHAFEAYYDYGPNVFSFVGSSLNKIFYDRGIFTDVSGS